MCQNHRNAIASLWRFFFFVLFVLFQMHYCDDSNILPTHQIFSIMQCSITPDIKNFKLYQDKHFGRIVHYIRLQVVLQVSSRVQSVKSITGTIRTIKSCKTPLLSHIISLYSVMMSIIPSLCMTTLYSWNFGFCLNLV